MFFEEEIKVDIKVLKGKSERTENCVANVVPNTFFPCTKHNMYMNYYDDMCINMCCDCAQVVYILINSFYWCVHVCMHV